MQLADYGMIALNGTVKHPQPGASFQDYQTSLVSHQMALTKKERAAAARAEQADTISSKPARNLAQ